jgi:hypothetical protein
MHQNVTKRHIHNSRNTPKLCCYIQCILLRGTTSGIAPTVVSHPLTAECRDQFWSSPYDKGTMAQVFLRIIRFSDVSISPPLLVTYI